GAGDLIVQDVAADGRWLVTRDVVRRELLVHTERDSATRRAGWLDNPFWGTISHDGQLLAFAEGSSESGAYYSVMLRPMDGGKAVRLGVGAPAWFSGTAFSRDHRLLLAFVQTRPARLVIYPTGAGVERVVPTDGLETIDFAAWGAGDSTVAYCGNDARRRHG